MITKAELDVDMMDWWKEIRRPTTEAQRPPAPKIQVDTSVVRTKREPQPFETVIHRRTVNSNGNPDNSVHD